MRVIFDHLDLNLHVRFSHSSTAARSTYLCSSLSSRRRRFVPLGKQQTRPADQHRPLPVLSNAGEAIPAGRREGSPCLEWLDAHCRPDRWSGVTHSTFTFPGVGLQMHLVLLHKTKIQNAWILNITSVEVTRMCRPPTETGRVFTWGRGNYGQLGRLGASASQGSESLSTSDEEKLEARLPGEVEALRGATQVRHGPLSHQHCYLLLSSSCTYNVRPAGGGRGPQTRLWGQWLTPGQHARVRVSESAPLP